MFTTLLTHEFRTMARRDLLLIAALAVAFGVAYGIAAIDLPGVTQFMQVVAVLAAIAVVPAVLAHIGVEYWQSMYGRRGYFTMTLPVNGTQLFAAKAVYAVVMGAIALAVAVGGVAVLIGDQVLTWSITVGQVRVLFEQYGRATVIAFIVGAVITYLAQIVQGAAVLTFSADERFHRLGYAAPLVGLVLLYLFSQVLSLLGMLFVPLSLDLASGDIGARIPAPGMWDAVRNGTEAQVMGLGSFVLIPLAAIVFAILAARQIDRRTSLV